MFCLLCQRSQHEFTFLDSRVRNLKTLMVDLLALIKQDVKIDVPWAFIDDLHASHIILNALKNIEKGQRLQIRLNLAT